MRPSTRIMSVAGQRKEVPSRPYAASGRSYGRSSSASAPLSRRSSVQGRQDELTAIMSQLDTLDAAVQQARENAQLKAQQVSNERAELANLLDQRDHLHTLLSQLPGHAEAAQRAATSRISRLEETELFLGIRADKDERSLLEELLVLHRACDAASQELTKARAGFNDAAQAQPAEFAEAERLRRTLGLLAKGPQAVSAALKSVHGTAVKAVGQAKTSVQTAAAEAESAEASCAASRAAVEGLRAKCALARMRTDTGTRASLQSWLRGVLRALQAEAGAVAALGARAPSSPPAGRGPSSRGPSPVRGSGLAQQQSSLSSSSDWVRNAMVSYRRGQQAQGQGQGYGQAAYGRDQASAPPAAAASAADVPRYARATASSVALRGPASAAAAPAAAAGDRAGQRAGAGVSSNQAIPADILRGRLGLAGGRAPSAGPSRDVGGQGGRAGSEGITARHDGLGSSLGPRGTIQDLLRELPPAHGLVSSTSAALSVHDADLPLLLSGTDPAGRPLDFRWLEAPHSGPVEGTAARAAASSAQYRPAFLPDDGNMDGGGLLSGFPRAQHGSRDGGLRTQAALAGAAAGGGPSAGGGSVASDDSGRLLRSLSPAPRKRRSGSLTTGPPPGLPAWEDGDKVLSALGPVTPRTARLIEQALSGRLDEDEDEPIIAGPGDNGGLLPQLPALGHDSGSDAGGGWGKAAAEAPAPRPTIPSTTLSALAAGDLLIPSSTRSSTGGLWGEMFAAQAQAQNRTAQAHSLPAATAAPQASGAPRAAAAPDSHAAYYDNHGSNPRPARPVRELSVSKLASLSQPKHVAAPRAGSPQAAGAHGQPQGRSSSPLTKTVAFAASFGAGSAQAPSATMRRSPSPVGKAQQGASVRTPPPAIVGRPVFNEPPQGMRATAELGVAHYEVARSSFGGRANSPLASGRPDRARSPDAVKLSPLQTQAMLSRLYRPSPPRTAGPSSSAMAAPAPAPLPLSASVWRDVTGLGEMGSNTAAMRQAGPGAATHPASTGQVAAHEGSVSDQAPVEDAAYDVIQALLASANEDHLMAHHGAGAAGNGDRAQAAAVPGRRFASATRSSSAHLKPGADHSSGEVMDGAHGPRDISRGRAGRTGRTDGSAPGPGQMGEHFARLAQGGGLRSSAGSGRTSMVVGSSKGGQGFQGKPTTKAQALAAAKARAQAQANGQAAMATAAALRAQQAAATGYAQLSRQSPDRSAHVAQVLAEAQARPTGPTTAAAQAPAQAAVAAKTASLWGQVLGHEETTPAAANAPSHTGDVREAIGTSATLPPPQPRLPSSLGPVQSAVARHAFAAALMAGTPLVLGAAGRNAHALPALDAPHTGPSTAIHSSAGSVSGLEEQDGMGSRPGVYHAHRALAIDAPDEDSTQNLTALLAAAQRLLQKHQQQASEPAGVASHARGSSAPASRRSSVGGPELNGTGFTNGASGHASASGQTAELPTDASAPRPAGDRPPLPPKAESLLVGALAKAFAAYSSSSAL